MKQLRIFLILILFAFSCNPSRKLVNKTWYYRPTLSGNGVQVYQDTTAGMPPSRGITAYQFLADGKLILKAPDTNDRLQYDTGTWRMEKQQLHLSFPQKNKEYTMKVLELKKHLFRIEPSR